MHGKRANASGGPAVMEQEELLCCILRYLSPCQRGACSLTARLVRTCFMITHPPTEEFFVKAIEEGGVATVLDVLDLAPCVAGHPVRRALSCHLAHAIRHRQLAVAEALRGRGASDHHVLVSVAAAESGDVGALRRSASPPSAGVPRPLYQQCLRGVGRAALLSPEPAKMLRVVRECGFPLEGDLPRQALTHRRADAYMLLDEVVDPARRDMGSEVGLALEWGDPEVVQAALSRAPDTPDIFLRVVHGGDLATVRRCTRRAQAVPILAFAMVALRGDPEVFGIVLRRYLRTSHPSAITQDARSKMLFSACSVGDVEAIRSLRQAGGVFTQRCADIARTPEALREAAEGLGDAWNAAQTVNVALNAANYRMARVAWDMAPTPLEITSVHWSSFFDLSPRLLECVLDLTKEDREAFSARVVRCAITMDIVGGVRWALDRGAEWTREHTLRAARNSPQVLEWAVRRGLAVRQHFDIGVARVNVQCVGQVMDLGVAFSVAARTSVAWYALYAGDLRLLRRCGTDVRLTCPRLSLSVAPHPAVVPHVWDVRTGQDGRSPELGYLGYHLHTEHAVRLARDERLSETTRLKLCRRGKFVPRWGAGGPYSGWDSFFDSRFRTLCWMSTLDAARAGATLSL